MDNSIEKIESRNPKINFWISFEENNVVQSDLADDNFTDSDCKFEKLYRNQVFLNDKANFENSFLDAIKNYDIEDFYYSFADKTFDSYLDKYGIAAVEWLNRLLIMHIHDAGVVCGVLKVLSNVAYEKMQTFGFSMLIVTLYNYNDDKNVEVSDLILSCIENWDNAEFISILNGMKTDVNFIKHYKGKVAKNLAA